MTINITDQIKTLRDTVWGVVTNPVSQIEQLTLLIFLKLLSVRHNELERIGSKKLIFTGDFSQYHFDALSRLSGNELVDNVRKAIESLSKNPNLEEPIKRLYERSYLQINDPRVLSLLIQEIKKMDIGHLDMGDFYEHLLSILGTQKDAGQFRTPRHIIKFMVDVVDPKIGEKILDPACGTAGFLTFAFLHIRDANTSEEAKNERIYLDKLNPDQRKFLLNEAINGFDIDPQMIKFAITNLYLHDIKNPKISQHDTLTNNDLWEKKFDVILANPPFSTPKGGIKPSDNFSLDSNRTEVLFVEYIIEHLSYNGRAGVIVPEGIIFQSGKKAYQKLRQWLVENNNLWAVVSLPSGMFNPYSGVKTCILFIDKEIAKKSNNILFYKINFDGYDLGAQRKPSDRNDLPHALEIIKTYKDLIMANQKLTQNDYLHEPLVNVVPKDKIVQSGDWNLRGERYRKLVVTTHQKWTIVELGDVLEYEQPTKYIVSSENYSDEFKTPVLTAGKTFVLGNTNETQGIFEKDLPVIIFDDFTTAIKFVDFPFKVKSSAMKILHAKKDKADIRFLFQMMRGIKFNSSTHKRYWISEYTKIKIPLPPLEVQKEIVKEIDGYQKIIDGAKQMVREWYPYPDIINNWQTKKIGEIAEINPSKPNFKEWHLEKDVSFLPMSSLDVYSPNPLNLEKRKLKDVVKGYTFFQDDDILLAKITPCFENGKSGIVKNLTNGVGFGSTEFIVIRANKKIVLPLWIWLFIYQKEFINQGKNHMTGSAGQKRLPREFVANYQIPVPDMATQEKQIKKIQLEFDLIQQVKKHVIPEFEKKIDDIINNI